MWFYEDEENVDFRRIQENNREKLMESFYSKDSSYNTLLRAFDNNNLNLFRAILEGFQEDPNEKHLHGYTFLHFACHHGKLEIAEYLLKNPYINPNKQTIDGYTPFFVACLNNNIKIIKILMEDFRVDPSPNIHDIIHIIDSKNLLEILMNDPRINHLDKAGKDEINKKFIFACCGYNIGIDNIKFIKECLKKKLKYNIH